MRRKLQAIKQELRQRIHQSIPVQGKWLRQVVTGYFNYHAVPTNSPALTAFRFFVTEFWQRTLRRRGQKDGMTWERITRLANDWLPKPRILHPWPQARFAVTHPRWEPYAGIPLVRGHVARGLVPSPALSPLIEPVVQVDVGEQRRDYRSLPRPLITDVHDPVFQDPALSH